MPNSSVFQREKRGVFRGQNVVTCMVFVVILLVPEADLVHEAYFEVAHPVVLKLSGTS